MFALSFGTVLLFFSGAGVLNIQETQQPDFPSISAVVPSSLPMLSADNSIVDGVRQKPITKKYVENFVMHNAELNGRTHEEVRNFHRNEKLIDLNETPQDICKKIWEEYRVEPKGQRRDLLNFFVEKKLNNLIETIGDF